MLFDEGENKIFFSSETSIKKEKKDDAIQGKI